MHLTILEIVPIPKTHVPAFLGQLLVIIAVTLLPSDTISYTYNTLDIPL